MADTKLSAVATEATPSVGDERLYGVQDLGGSPTSVYHKLGDIRYYGTTAPSTPEAGFKWFDTTLNMEFVYGTFASASRWVSVNKFLVFAYAGSGLGYSTSATGLTSIASQHSIYIERLMASSDVLTTNNGSNYWTANIRYVTGTTAIASGAGTLLGGFNTTADTAGTWYQKSVSIDAVVDPSTDFVFVDIIKTSSPGNFVSGASLECRYVHA